AALRPGEAPANVRDLPNVNDRPNTDTIPADQRTLKVGTRTGLVLLIGICCVGFLIADVATPTWFESPFSAMLALGIVTAQLTVICVWGTLVRGTFWIRLPWTILLLVVSWCGFALGITLENGSPDIDAMLATAALWSFGFVTSVVPLKIAALCFRWQIVQVTAYDKNPERRSSFAIRDLLIGTLFLAVTMGIGRAMLPGDGISISRALQASSLDEAEPLFAVTLFGVVSLLVKLPCIWISLGERSEKIMSRIGIWIPYCFALTVFEIGLLVAVLGDPGDESVEVFSGMIISHQLMGAIMLGVCLTLRGLGYRLERSMKHDAAAAELT
ncbi:MAG: hypothetical protein AAGA03_15255, partial [Planctomycetota bacterium]